MFTRNTNEKLYSINSFRYDNYDMLDLPHYKTLKVKCSNCNREFQVFRSLHTKQVNNWTSTNNNYDDKTYYTRYRTYCNKCKNNFNFITYVST